MTTTTIQKWGNSYAVRLPKHAVEKLQLRAGSVVTVTEGDNQSLSIAPAHHAQMELAELVSLITPENSHEYISWGGAHGNEAW